MALEHVLAPITLNGVEIRNRVVRTAHGTNIGRGRIDDDLIAYHLARGEGGVGLSLLEAASVHRTDTGTLRIHDDSCIEDFRRLMDVIRPTGMRMFHQLGHLGHDGVPMDEGVAPWSASAVVSPNYGWTAHAMTVDDIEEMIACFARAAVWGREGGLEGVEVHAAHGYLLQEFQSPVTNLRTDRYGGSAENRMRFTMEVLRAVRTAVGDDYVVGVRTGADGTDEGVDAEDCADLVRAIEATGLVDYVNVTFGGCRRSHKIIGAMHEPTGYELPTSEVVTKATRLPSIVTGRFRTLAEVDEVIAAGLADMVGMTRAHIADPHIVRKTMAGRAAEVRPCIACNQGCVGGLAIGKMGCAVNADVGFEHQHVDAYATVAEPHDVLVVGGGPSGMEAARVAAVRGHRVVLCEAGHALGGNIRHSRRFPEHALIGDSIDWLAAELQRLGVDVRLDTRVDDDTMTALAPDAVIVATGTTSSAGVGEWTSAEIAALEVPPLDVSRATVIDEFGGYEVIGVTERLVGWGIDVTVVTPFDVLAPRILRELVLIPALERIDRGPGSFALRTTIDVAALPVAQDGEVVVRVGRRATPLPLHRPGMIVVGDAAEPGHLWSAIRSGNEAGRTV